MTKVSLSLPNNVVTGIMFVESSALNASNVSTAFEMLVGSIYKKLLEGQFDDRLDQFNYFGS